MSKPKRTHRRWPQGFPSGLYVGRQQGFTSPSGFQRQAASMTHAIRGFDYQRIAPPKFGKPST